MRSRTHRLLGRSLLALGAVALVIGTLPAGAATAVGLGTAAEFSVLAGSTVTNTGPTTLTGSVGVSPGTAITGFPPGIVGGTIHSADATAAQAQTDTTTAYDTAASQTPATAVAVELGGRALEPGVYRNGTLGITGTLTLDAQGDPDAVFVFQADTLITASGSRVNLINGAQACNVFWQIGSSATIGTSTQFVGTVLALTSITANNGATVQGRLLARNGAVTLDNNVITTAACAAQTTTTTAPTTTTTAAPTSTTAAPTTTTAAPTTTTTVAATPVGTGGTPTGTATPTPGLSGTPTAATPTGGGGGGGLTTSSLPRTGSGLTALAIGGAMSLLLGAAMVRRAATA